MALNKVPMSVEEGEIKRRIGPNDAGKKTLKDAATALLEKKTCRIYAT